MKLVSAFKILEFGHHDSDTNACMGDVGAEVGGKARRWMSSDVDAKP